MERLWELELLMTQSLHENFARLLNFLFHIQTQNLKNKPLKGVIFQTQLPVSHQSLGRND